jgi:hypothetical protein
MREMGLGPALGRTAVSLSAARVKARELHALVRDGRDPLAEREAEKVKADADAEKPKAGAMTFAQVEICFMPRRPKPSTISAAIIALPLSEIADLGRPRF